MSTEILPVPAEPPVEPPADPGVAEPKRKRRGWIVALVVVASLIVLGIVAFVVADAVAKSYARDYVRDRIVAVLGLPADAEVDVDLGGGSIILQALAGRVDTVDVAVPEVAFGELTGDVTLHAEGVPLDATAPVEVLRVDFAIEADDLATLGQGADPATAPTFEFGEGEILLSSRLELFGATIPIGVAVAPSAAEGDLVLTPTSVTIGGETFEAGADDDSFFGQIVGALLQPQNLCIAGSVPQALILTEAAIDGPRLVLAFRADGAALGGPELATLGTCAA